MSGRSSEISEKLAISLPRTLFLEIEKLRKHFGESRSSFIQRAIRSFLQNQVRKGKINRYVAGYSENPETAEEIKAAETAATYLLAEEPWE